VRVTLVNKYYFPPHLGGIEASLNMLATELASLPGMSARVIVSNEARTGSTETIDGVEIVRLPRLFAAASTPVAPGMARELRAEAGRADPPDVMHLHFPYPWGEVSWLRAKPGIPTVLTYHSDIIRQRVLGAAYAPILRRVLDRVDRIVVGSPAMVESSPFLRPHAAKCRVVPFGIRVERFAPTPQVLERAEALRREHQRPIVLFVGRLIYYKGVDVLLRAMRDVDADLVLVGSGPLEVWLRDLAARLGIAERVTFLAPLPEPELVAWYHTADVFCLPSVARSEAYGLVQLEAHASGTPVVSTDLPTGVPFVNPDGETGLIVPPGDANALAAALSRLLSDDPLRERMGARARERALAGFSIAAMTDALLGVYSEAVQSRSSGA
jgi:glycosyltransferase involved in cell wall biosynthesis